MNKEEFKEYCEEFDDNITDKIPEDKFDIVCKKCKKTNVQVLMNGKQVSMGSEYTGAYTSQDFNLVFKCIDCGSAISIIDDCIESIDASQDLSEKEKEK